MANYRKWDSLDVDSSDEEEPDLTPAAEEGQRLFSEWIVESNPEIQPTEVEHIINFIEVQQQRIGHEDNRPRAAEIIDFLESHDAPKSEHLLITAWDARLRDSAEPSEAARLIRMKAALTSALNTLEAVRKYGGARKLFDAILADSSEKLAKEYSGRKFAHAALERHAEKVVSAASLARAPHASTAGRMLTSLKQTPNVPEATSNSSPTSPATCEQSTGRPSGTGSGVAVSDGRHAELWRQIMRRAKLACTVGLAVFVCCFAYLVQTVER
jgi:hypothetical protein